MQRMTSTITAVLLAAAVLLPENSVFQGVLRQTRGHLHGLAKESTRQVESLIHELDESLEKLANTSSHALKHVLNG